MVRYGYMFFIVVRFLGHFCTYLVTDKDYFWHQNLTVCTSCKTSYNVLSHSHIYRGWGWGMGVVHQISGGGGVKKRESPDFKSLEAGISAMDSAWDSAIERLNNPSQDCVF